MIVHTMTVQEIHRELHADVKNTGRTVLYRLDKFKSVVLKSNRYPVRRHYECKSLVKKNRFFVQLTAFKRSEWKNPLIEYYCIYDRPEGLYCATVNIKAGLTFIFPPHFFSRYRERVIRDAAISNIDLIHLFISRLWNIYLVHMKELGKEEIENWDNIVAEENLEITGVFTDGVIFGERQGDVLIGKTMISESMLRKDQKDLCNLLYDEYMGSLYGIYPKHIVEYIMDLQMDYYDPGDHEPLPEEDTAHTNIQTTLVTPPRHSTGPV